MTRREKQQILERLREEMTRSALSRYQIGKRSGVNEAALSRFMKGGSLTVETIERLAPVLGLELVLQPPGRTTATKKKKVTADDSDLQGLRRPTPKDRLRNSRKRG